jgi:U2 small nuclear ribonucleoprotein B''
MLMTVRIPLYVLFLISFALVDGAAVAPTAKRPNVQMPDEYLPPNKILFLQNLPESVTKVQLEALFAQ